MKLIYCINSLYNPGGMERVLLNKVQWMLENADKNGLCRDGEKPEIIIVTTDQQGRETFYPFPKEVRMIDLGIDYSLDNGKSFIKKFLAYLKKRRVHRHKLTELLLAEKADIVDCFYPGECSFVPKIQDGSKKVLELHQSKLFNLQYNRSGLMGLADKYRARSDEKLVRKFDRFVVLTKEDAQMWGEIPTMIVIPNAPRLDKLTHTDLSQKRVIAVGRLDYQKSFDRLIDAWKIVHDMAPDWHLDIFGQGPWKEMLQSMIDEKKLTESITVNAPTKNIEKEYADSSILVMSSHYEGFPMVMIEGMACGLPVVSFDFKCGPRDIIREGIDGYIAADGDIDDLAQGMLILMKDRKLLEKMSMEAGKVSERFSVNRVMGMWADCYRDLLA